MVLEATMIVVDNSEHSRNGDYLPTRWDAQKYAVNTIFSRKTCANPESSIGLMSMGAQGPKVLTTLTTDAGKLLEGLHGTEIRGSAHFLTAVEIAALALKHRQNKSQKQRIIVFNCSPISDDAKSLTKLAQRMKKNNVNVDIVAFGGLDDDEINKLKAFNNALKGGSESHLAVVQPGPNILSDIIAATPILAGEDGGASSAMAGTSGDHGAGQNDFDVDPSLEPELALALRLSYEEERARQERDRKAQEAKEGKTELEDIPESDEKQSRIGEGAESSGSTVKDAKPEEEKNADADKVDDVDKMDIE